LICAKEMNQQQPWCKEKSNDYNRTIESFKANFQLSAKSIRRGLSGRAVFGMVGVLAALFFAGMFPRWRANATLTSAARDRRPTVNVFTTQRPDGAATLVLPGSTQAIQETAIYARTNGCPSPAHAAAPSFSSA
jgi:hypothetical protein